MNYKVSLSLSFSSKLKPDYHKCLLMTFGRHIHLYIYIRISFLSFTSYIGIKFSPVFMKYDSLFIPRQRKPTSRHTLYNSKVLATQAFPIVPV